MVIPECLKNKILIMMHDELGHASAEKTLVLIRKRFYWPGMSSYIDNYIKIVVDVQLQRQVGNCI